MAMGLGAQVVVLDPAVNRLAALAEQFGPALQTRMASAEALQTWLPTADVIIGAALVPGGAAPQVLQRGDLAQLQTGAVLVDVAIDQGGCFASSKPTSHDAPTYVEQGVNHYCVANMPGAVPVTATLALSQVTLPAILRLANGGAAALRQDRQLAAGVNVQAGRIVHPAVAQALAANSGDEGWQ